MEENQEKSHQESIADIDADVEKMGKRLLEEGYKFNLDTSNESIIVLEAGGRIFNFTKKKKYDVKTASGGYEDKDIEKVIEERIREFGKE